MKNDKKLKAKLVDYVQDAHAMELNVEMMLESMIKAAKDTKTKAMLEAHLQQTHDHKHRLDQLSRSAGLAPFDPQNGRVRGRGLSPRD